MSCSPAGLPEGGAAPACPAGETPSTSFRGGEGARSSWGGQPPQPPRSAGGRAPGKRKPAAPKGRYRAYAHHRLRLRHAFRSGVAGAGLKNSGGAAGGQRSRSFHFHAAATGWCGAGLTTWAPPAPAGCGELSGRGGAVSGQPAGRPVGCAREDEVPPEGALGLAARPSFVSALLSRSPGLLAPSLKDPPSPPLHDAVLLSSQEELGDVYHIYLMEERDGTPVAVVLPGAVVDAGLAGPAPAVEAALAVGLAAATLATTLNIFGAGLFDAALFTLGPVDPAAVSAALPGTAALLAILGEPWSGGAGPPALALAAARPADCACPAAGVDSLLNTDSLPGLSAAVLFSGIFSPWALQPPTRRATSWRPPAAASAWPRRCCCRPAWACWAAWAPSPASAPSSPPGRRWRRWRWRGRSPAPPRRRRSCWRAWP